MGEKGGAGVSVHFLTHNAHPDGVIPGLDPGIHADVFIAGTTYPRVA
jgi:hypothetical protein